MKCSKCGKECYAKAADRGNSLAPDYVAVSGCCGAPIEQGILKKRDYPEDKIINDGGPAFPCISGSANYHQEGMSLRDYFAAKAMQGLVSDGAYLDKSITAKNAYEIADAMIKARGEEK